MPTGLWRASEPATEQVIRLSLLPNDEDGFS